MKYPRMDWGTMEAIVNKLGGLDGVRHFLNGQITITAASNIDEMERVETIVDANVAEQLSQELETIVLGKVWSIQELRAMVEEINRDLVNPGEQTWRLPTTDELLSSKARQDGRFGNWMVWSGDPWPLGGPEGCVTIVTMSAKEGHPLEKFGDYSGSMVSAYLVKTGQIK